MRAVVQRALRGSVSVGPRLVASIGPGAVVFVGVAQGDDESAARYMADKVACLRMFADQEGKMNLSLLDVGGEVLVVSQFTLYGDCRKGRRPSFAAAAPPFTARPLYESFGNHLRQLGLRVKTGEFGAMMQVEVINDGPVTFLIDSERRF